MKLRRFWIILRREFRLFFRLFKDPRTPIISKVIMILTLIYLISPIDIIPDIIPFAGFIDELIVIPLLFWLALRFIPKEIVDEHKRIPKGAKSKFENVQEGVVVE